MKNSILILATCICFAGAMLSGCDTPAKNVKDAEAKLERAHQELAQFKRDSIQQEDWLAFKAASQEKITANNMKISELKAEKRQNGLTTDDAYKNQIMALEDRNFLLQRRIDDYEKYNSNWEVFKREFNQDMDDLGAALKEFADNKLK